MIQGNAVENIYILSFHVCTYVLYTFMMRLWLEDFDPMVNFKGANRCYIPNLAASFDYQGYTQSTQMGDLKPM